MANEIYNTSWWGNAIDTAITAGTEPDFFGSQMKMLTGQQPELVTNGDFATDSAWHKEPGWTISGGTANANSPGGTKPISQNVSGLTAGKTYKVSLTVSEVTSGYFRVYAYVGVSGAFTNILTTPNLQNGTYEVTFEFGGTDNTFRIYGSLAGGDLAIGSIDNVSVKLARAEEVEAVKCLADWIHTTALQDLNN